MNTAVWVATLVLVVILTLAFARERRLRVALQRLLAKLLSYWRSSNEANDEGEVDETAVRPVGRDRLRETQDERLTRMAEESVATQARQNERMAEQSQEVAETSKRLVEYDAEARRAMIVTQMELQLEDERASLDGSGKAWKASGATSLTSAARTRSSPRQSAHLA